MLNNMFALGSAGEVANLMNEVLVIRIHQELLITMTMDPQLDLIATILAPCLQKIGVKPSCLLHHQMKTEMYLEVVVLEGGVCMCVHTGIT